MNPRTAVPRRLELALPSGMRLACRADGPAARAPQVLLLHGFPEAAFVWDEVMARLAEGPAPVTALAPNLRGYVGSSAPAEVQAYRARHLVADIAQAIEALGAPLPLLVAHDWGGALAWNLAAAHPQLIGRLLIINAPHPATFLRELRGNPGQQQASAYMNWLCRDDAAERLRADGYAKLLRFFGSPPWLDATIRARYAEAWDAALPTMLNYYRASPLRPPAGPDDPVHALDLPDSVVRVRVPTTVLWGEADRALLPGLLDGLGAWVDPLEVRRVAGASHWIVHEQPGLVVATIRELLARD